MKLLAVFLLVFCPVGLSAQESVTTSGGNGSGSSGSVSYTIGQLLYTTSFAVNGSAAHGVQQPYEISVVVGIQREDVSLFCSAYPVPATGNVTLKVEHHDNQQLSFQLYDASGKLLENGIIKNEKTILSIGRYPSGTLLLYVKSDTQAIKVFKIIKKN